jgi:hypothetical protein
VPGKRLGANLPGVQCLPQFGQGLLMPWRAHSMTRGTRYRP